MARQRRGNYLWVTWLSKLMAGGTQCQWAPWFRTHYQDWQKVPSNFQLAKWQAEHTQALSELISERSGLGESIRKEDQNSFKINMTPSLVLAGKPDLVTMDGKGDVTVYDVKTGSARQSDLIQAMLYMLCLPAALPMYKGKTFSGCVVYSDREPSHVPPEALSEEFRKRARYFVNLLDSPTPPTKTSSPSDCRFCDITVADCCDRIEINEEDGETPVLDW